MKKILFWVLFPITALLTIWSFIFELAGFSAFYDAMCLFEDWMLGYSKDGWIYVGSGIWRKY